MTGGLELRPQEWLLIEWPAGRAEPTKYWLSTLPEDTRINELVSAAQQRWRIERDYQELKQEFGLGHYEGRAGAASTTTPALMHRGLWVPDGRATHRRPTVGSKKNSRQQRQVPALPADYIPRGSPARAAPRPASITTLRHRLSATASLIEWGYAPAAEFEPGQHWDM